VKRPAGRGGRGGRGGGRGGGGRGGGRPATPAKRQKSSDEASSASEPELSEHETSEEEDSDAAAGTGSDEEGAARKAARPKAGAPKRVARQTTQRQAAAVVKSLAEDSDDSESEEDSRGGAPGASPSAPASQGRRGEALAAVGVAQAGGGPAALVEYEPVTVSWGKGEDADCSVCGDGEATEGNEILLCEGRRCSVAVHQACYGVAKVPKGRWLCDGCKAGRPPEGANCCACPVTGGALRGVTAMGRVAQLPAGQTGAAGAPMVHLACALWTPEITIANAGLMAGVSLAGLSAQRQALMCALCKQAGGAVV
jgi:hypothetical protein